MGESFQPRLDNMPDKVEVPSITTPYLSTEAASIRANESDEDLFHFGEIRNEADVNEIVQLLWQNPKRIIMLSTYSGGALDSTREALSVGVGGGRVLKKIRVSNEGRDVDRPVTFITEDGKKIALAVFPEDAKQKIQDEYRSAA